MNSNQSAERNWLDEFSALIEQNILGVKIVIYGVGFLGLGIALRSVRPFKKLVSPQRIPKNFINTGLKLHGRVVGIDFSPKALILIDHEPLLGASLRRRGHLPVNLEGINISANGISWIQNIIVGKKVDFIILTKEDKYISCLVYDDKRNIASHLVSIGFASAAPFNMSLENDEEYKNFYSKLLEAENMAERKCNGIWWDSPRRFSVLDFIVSVMPRLKFKTALRRI